MATSSKNKKHACSTGKRPYDSLQEAQTAAIVIVKSKAKGKNPIVSHMRAYACACGKFHIGRTKGINWDLLSAVPLRQW